MPRIIGIMERTDLRVWAVHLADGSRGLVHNPIEETGATGLFKGNTTRSELCNVPMPAGTLPEDEAWRVNGLGLGLNFSDFEMYGLCFRYLELVFIGCDRPIYPLRAQQFLDGMISEEHDPEPGFGFAWSQRFGRSVNLGVKQTYGVDLITPEPLRSRLRDGAHNVKQGKDSRWFAEIRVYLLGQRTRRIQ